MEFDYVLTTDSDAEMPYEWLEEFDIQAILMPYSMDGKEYFFNFFREMPFNDFYDRLRNGEKVTTAQRNPQDFKEFWTPFLEQGKDVLYVGLSSELSGTFNSATMARAELLETFPERKIILVDTLAISVPEAMIVREAAKRRLAGDSIEEVAQWVEENRNFYTAFFMVDDLNYLKRGGRVSSSAAFFGSMLDIKPIIYISPRGKLEPFEKAKGRKKGIRRMVELIKEHYDPEKNEYVVIAQADCEKDSELIRDMLKEAIDPGKICIQPVGPVIGSHAGPGTLGVGFIAKRDDIEPAK
ncbi:MAG: DegV family protein [Christensenellales bacterium]